MSYLNQAYPKPPRLFLGKEVEVNSTYGRQTLFVCDDVSPDRILDTLYRELIEVVYFGAGHLSRVNTKTLKEITKLGLDVMVETPDIELIHRVFRKGDIPLHLTIPLTNTGQRISGAWETFKKFYRAYSKPSSKDAWFKRWDLSLISVKFDHEDGHVLTFPLYNAFNFITLPVDFKKDKDLK